MSEPDELVRVEHVTFSYNTLPVLEDISFSIYRGDFLSVIGPNGSGKTTLIKIILGLLKPSRGAVSIMGRPVAEFRDWSKVGYVPQKATHIDPFFPASVREVVAMALLSTRSPFSKSRRDTDRQVMEALRKVAMESSRNAAIGSLSGGQQQRVMIARALVTSPEILLLDEPTTGVDLETQHLFYEMLHELNDRQRITIVLITHDIGVVNRHVKKVACLNQQLIYHGTHKEFCQSEAFKILIAEGHIVSHSH
ncbi:MAG: zinc ABC transporter ATP-binding protein [Candidatus Aminicenantes bacterium RBG_16_63_16]|nr:MAG: zinc ABC transporter ATP-binding protein [Candidatus Aminicenantes bacterium RBG_16_63_16]